VLVIFVIVVAVGGVVVAPCVTKPTFEAKFGSLV
jgi:hypothetical protein